MRSLIVALILVVAVALPAHGHTWRELNEWLEGWHQRLADALSHATGDTPSSLNPYAALEAVLAEYDDMRRRHPRWDGTFQASGADWAEVSSIAVFGDRVERWRPLVAAYFKPGDVDRVLCLMGYESGGNPSARNPRSSATGLMQILYSLWGPPFGLTSRAELEDPDTNLRIARFIRDSQGWGAWSPYNRGLCR